MRRIWTSTRACARHLARSALMLLVAGAAGASLAAQKVPAFPTLPADLPVGEGRTQPCLEQAPGTALCGRFRVYENREARSGRTIDVAFVVLKALQDRGNRDAFTLFNGGPGGPATDGAFVLARALPDIRADRDILLIDHRGTGASGALFCDNPFPGGIRSRFQTIFPLDHLEACRQRLSRRADLTQYNTPNAMDDLSDVVAWLGYSGLDLMGGSYGTREAQVFVRRHPDQVRTVIFNGVAALDDHVYLYHARDLQEALEDVVAECATQDACRRAYPDLASVLASVLTTARDHPHDVTVEGTTLPFGIGPLSYALRGLLYGQAGSVPARLYEAQAGNWQRLANYYVARQAWVGAADDVPAGYHLSTLCAEDINSTTWSDIARETSGTFMGDFLVGAYKRACEQWPAATLPAAFFRSVHSDKPALFLSGGRDPVTPAAGAEAVAKGFPNSIQVVVPNGGHGQGGPCIRAMMVHLIRKGSVTGIDTSCVQSAPPTRFELPGG